ncbi:WbqC family protein [Oceaniradius stylonematis]|jgi:hypothetical protein|uniref:WbqC family protein n=1 Tax=Oceaniradius stylonematis TaxID=2184161 RepID=UPI0035D06A7D
MTRIAIVQSAYIPWRGYFDMIGSVDAFILYDDVQYTTGDWRNRNRIRTSNGPKWLTLPVQKKHRLQRRICDVEVSDPGWGGDHWNKLEQSYRKAPAFEETARWLRPLYETEETNLSRINCSFLTAICGFLGIKTPLGWSWDYEKSGDRSERVLALCRAAGADTYVSGPAAKGYLDVGLFESAGVSVEWFSYDRLEPYPQIHGGFEQAVSIVDLLFNCGPQARDHLPSLRRTEV